VRAALDGAVNLQRHPGDPRSFDRLDALLSDQAYRLAFWRVAAEEINYRRFFDVNDLAGLRTRSRRFSTTRTA
jgi:(1->4)-alpha-D-glucan 1-alpha-D-glucosylmutase